MSSDIESWPPPDDANAFESLCLCLWKEVWNDPNAQKNGRSGQPQAGVDVFGLHEGRQIGVQCKQKDGLLRSKLTVAELEHEVEEAKNFRPALSRFIVATTGPRDARVQERARLLTGEHKNKGLFSVDVWSWKDIWHELYQRPELLGRIASSYWPRLAATSAGSEERHSRQNGLIWWLISLVAMIVIITFALRSFRNDRMGTNELTPENQHSQWLPPELPLRCTNIVISFGGLSMNVPILIAEILGGKSGTKFLMKDLPPEFVKDVDKMPGYSPRNRHMWVRREMIQYEIGGKKVEFPIAPLVISNRLFIEVDVPFQNRKRTITMSDDFDSELSQAPKPWDRNYNSNAFEVVNEYTNPVLQVIYKKANEVQVNGIFLVDTHDVLVAFNAMPLLISPRAVLIENQATQEVDIRALGSILTNIVVTLDTNAAYGIQFSDQKAMFKYPSWRYPGELAK